MLKQLKKVLRRERQNHVHSQHNLMGIDAVYGLIMNLHTYLWHMPHEVTFILMIYQIIGALKSWFNPGTPYRCALRYPGIYNPVPFSR